MSKRVNWKKRISEIPSRVQISKKTYYDVVWQKEITDTKGNHLCGMTNLNDKVITIKMDMTAKLTIETYIHEVIHSISDEYDLGLTENQVLKMEESLPYILKLDNIFKEE